MFPTQNTTVVAQGVALLTDKWRKLPNVVALLSSYLGEIQEVQNVLWDVIRSRWLAVATADNPTGYQSDQLDELGKLVGQQRMGLPNGEYGQVILLRVQANRSQGRAEDIIQLAAGIEYIGKNGVPYPDAAPFSISVPNYVEVYPASFIVEVWDVLTPFVAILLLKTAKPLGVWGAYHFSQWPDGNDFELCDGLDTAHTGQGVFGDAQGTANTGGLLVDGVVL